MSPKEYPPKKAPPRLSCAITSTLYNRKNHPTLGLPWGSEHKILSVMLNQYLDIVQELPEEKRPRFHAAFIEEYIRITSFPNTRTIIENADIGYGWLERMLERR